MNAEKRKATTKEYEKQRRARKEIRRQNEAKFEEVDRFYEGKKIEAAKYYNVLETKWDV